MKLLSYVVIAVISSGFTAWMFSGGHLVGPARRLNPPTVDLAYADFVSILLTVLAIILAALAISIGIIAFRTIAEIKDEARKIAQESSKAEVEAVLNTVPERVAESVDAQVQDRLPKAIEDQLQDAIEAAGRTGRLDEALQKALARMSFGGVETNRELQPGFEATGDEENDNA